MNVLRRILKLPNYHWFVVFLISGAFAIAFAFSSYNLFHYSMANLNFIREFGFMAVMEGALYQTFQIVLGAGLSLFCYLGFKLCEAELLMRYSRWKSE